MDFLDPFRLKDASEPHWYTMVIGINPSFYGKGYGTALMNVVMQKAKASRTRIYLETAELSNLQFYEKLGFKVVRELTQPESKLPLWTFKKVY